MLTRMLKLSAVLLVFLLAGIQQGRAQNVTITGTIQGANGLPAANTLLNFTPTQSFFVPGSNTTQQVGSISGSTAPTGSCAIANQFYTNTTTSQLYQCLYGAWVLVAGSNLMFPYPGVVCATSATAAAVCSPSQILAAIGNAGISNAYLANPSVNIGGTVCTLGSTCSPPGVAFPYPGVVCATSSTGGTVCSSSQILTAIGTANITNSYLANPSVNINGAACTLGTSCTPPLPPVGTAGTYAYPTSITTDTNGRVTHLVSGSAPTQGPSARQCNANGCYQIFADGTIDEWGQISMAANGSTYDTATITLPYAMTTQAIYTYSIVGSFSTDSTTPPCAQITSQTLTSASLYMARCIIAGAGGGQFDEAFTIDWYAKGN